MKLRTAIIGAGRMGRERARAARALGATVVTVCDTDVERASELACECGAEVITRSEQIRWQSLDAVFVCTPPGCRGELELEAIQAGVPLLVEKPIGTCAERGVPVLRALEKRPVINAVGYMNRYRRSVLEARDRIGAQPAMGVVFHWFGTQYRVPWWLNLDLSGGPVNEQCTHLIDLCRFFIGEIAAVSAIARPLSNASQVHGALALAMTFETGTLGVGIYGAESIRKQIAFEVFMPEDSIRLEGWDLRLTPPSGPDAEFVFLRETEVFFKAVQDQNQASILSDFRSAFATQRAVDAARRAAETGSREFPNGGEVSVAA